MSWVKEVNNMQNSISESMYIDIIEFYEYCEGEIEEIENLYQEFMVVFNKEILNFKENPDEGWALLCNYDEEVTELLHDCIMKKDEIENKCLQRLIGFQQQVLRINVRPSEASMIKARIIGFTRSTAKTLSSFAVDIFEKLQEVMLEMRDDIIAYVKGLIGTGLVDDVTFERIEIPEPILKKNEKIFNYKDMVKIALDNGYEYKWSNGSHNIYEHSKSQKIVVIPSHSLGLGLSKKIMKQIQANSA
ncbi:MAG: type II toxin-antitoxin system HicA family toxin [Clostridium sp.]